ncbi:MAG TPA: hypothetical protein VKB78_05150, partial [Pirellulales bacterium]|nr:hypothetical protein [Pirellulales bacterium]
MLWLNGTHIGDAGLMHIKKLPRLRYLILWDTQVTDAGLIHLKEMSQLETLEFYGTKVTAVGVTELQRALPKCEMGLADGRSTAR